MNLKRESDEKIAVFGGTFDPFTVAHRDICKQAMDKLPIDKLYVIPSVVSYHRVEKGSWLSDSERVWCIKEMLCTLGADYLGKWEVDETEIKLKAVCNWYDENDTRNENRHFELGFLWESIIKPRRFLHTLLDFKSRVGMWKQILLILGTDEVMDFTKWYHWEDVARLVSGIVLVNGRDGQKTEIPKEVQEKVSGYSCSLELSDSLLSLVSASRVRETCKHWAFSTDNYMDEVRFFDTGQASLNMLGWTRKEGANNG